MRNNKYSITFLAFFFTIYCFFIIVSFTPRIAQKITKHAFAFGDLFQMAKVSQFKKQLPSSINSTTISSSIEEAKIIIMGDSFFNVSPGYPQFSDQISNSVYVPIHNYNIQGGGELWRKTNPLEYLTGSQKNQEKKLLILESVDRGIELRYLTIKKEDNKTKQIKIRPIHSCKDDKKKPIGSLDSVLIIDRSLVVSGWAVDENSIDVKAITVLVDEVAIKGNLEMNNPRNDVANYFHNQEWRNSGFIFKSFTLPKRGFHTITALLTDSCGNTFRTPSKNVVVGVNLNEKLLETSNLINTFTQTKIKEIDFLLSENPISVLVNEYIATARFLIYGDISNLTPEYSKKPPMLFYKEEVSYVNKPIDPKTIDTISDNLFYISRVLNEKYNIQLLFVPMPNKYTVYMFNKDRKSPFLTELYRRLEEKKVHYINLLKPFSDKRIDDLFLASDTHLQKEGMDIVFAEVLKKLTEEQ